jgi:hypothetical protein
MLYLASTFYSQNPDASNPYQVIASACGVLYIFGIMAIVVGMRQLRVTGRGTGSLILFAVQLTGLFLALMCNILESAAPNMKQTSIFFVTDMAYPFSHLLMNIVGIAVIWAGAWRGWRRIPAFLCGLALPLFFALIPIVGRERGGIVFPIMVTAGFFLLGYAVRSTEQKAKITSF